MPIKSEGQGSSAFCCLHLLRLPAFVLCLARIRARLIYFKQLATSYINDFCAFSLSLSLPISLPLSLSLSTTSSVPVSFLYCYIRFAGCFAQISMQSVELSLCCLPSQSFNHDSFASLLSFQFESQKLSKLL